MSNVGSTTAGDIITAAKQRADMVNSSFITDAEWLAMCSASVTQLYDKIIEAYGNDYEVASSFAITTDGLTDVYTLPTDFYKLLGVDLQISNAGAGSATGWITLRRFNFADRNKYTLPNIQTLWGRTNLLYRLRGNNIWFIPLPMSGMPLRLWYIPRFTPFVATTDAFDPINGWQEWAINDMAIKARTKEETSIAELQQMQAVQEERLISVMQNRDAGSPSTVVDVSNVNGGNYGEWNGGDWSP